MQKNKTFLLASSEMIILIFGYCCTYWTWPSNFCYSYLTLVFAQQILIFLFWLRPATPQFWIVLDFGPTFSTPERIGETTWVRVSGIPHWPWYFKFFLHNRTINLPKFFSLLTLKILSVKFIAMIGLHFPVLAH